MRGQGAQRLRRFRDQHVARRHRGRVLADGERGLTPAPRGRFCGLLTLDVLHRVARFPAPDEKITADAQSVAAGGPATNAAVTFAALGGSAVLVTSVGSHPLALDAAAEVAARGVSVVDVTPARTSAPAVSSVRIGPDGSRNVTSPNASGVPVDVSTVSVEPGDADVVLCDGHLPGLALGVAAAARAAGVPVLLDCGSHKPVFDSLVPSADFVIASADYGRDALDGFRDLGVPAAAQTRGGRPVEWITADGSGAVDVPAVEVVDTLGAGDAFHGAAAFAIAAVGGATALPLWPQILSFAADVAGVRVTHDGPRSWLADPRLRSLAAPWLAQSVE